MSEIKEKMNVSESLQYIFFKNPVLVLGLVLGQLAAGDTTLQNGAALSVTYVLIVVPVLVFASVIGKKLPDWLRVVSYTVLAALMLVPAYFICGSFSATIFDSLGIYPALLAVSTVPVVFASKIAEKQSAGEAALTGLCIGIGFAVTALILGGAREFFGNGSLWGIKFAEAVYPAVKLPFWGFILLGFMAAGVSAASDFFRKGKEINKNEEENQ
ncbi:MAG: hypothetical protein IJ945_02980 [Oscillospiraceae bacterium]|nr:hypothetical protein [Oscillospiraceae bacterium]